MKMRLNRLSDLAKITDIKWRNKDLNHGFSNIMVHN